MKNWIEWTLGIAGGLLGVVLSFWAVRAIVYKVIEEKSVGRKTIKELKDKIETLEKEKVAALEKQLNDSLLLFRRIDLEVQSTADRLGRAEKFIDHNYEDIEELDKKVEILRQLQDNKLL